MNRGCYSAHRVTARVLLRERHFLKEVKGRATGISVKGTTGAKGGVFKDSRASGRLEQRE